MDATPEGGDISLPITMEPGIPNMPASAPVGCGGHTNKTNPGLISLQHFPLFLSLASGLSICYSDLSAHYSLLLPSPPLQMLVFCSTLPQVSYLLFFLFTLLSSTSPLASSLPPIIFSTLVFALCLGSLGCNLDNQMKTIEIAQRSRAQRCRAQRCRAPQRQYYSSCNCDVSLYSVR